MPKKSKRGKSLIKGNTLAILVALFLPIVINIVIISLSIEYINRLSSCGCFLDKDPNNAQNIRNMINLEYYFIFAIGLAVLYIVLSSFFKLRLPILIWFLLLAFLVARLLQLYFLYLTYGVFKDVSDDCECSNHNLRYILYTQAVLIVMALVL